LRYKHRISMDILLEFGTLLQSKRKQLGVSQKDLAELCGISDLTVRNIENGKEGTNIGNFLKVANTLGFDLLLQTKKLSDESGIRL
jgi:transcriptional regulator with XRE-family HTH domain